jgi:excisionase family DNA binding protein
MQQVIDTPGAAKYLGLSPATLETMRSKGRGPKFVKLGTAVRYRLSDLDEYLSARVVQSTSAQKVAA